MKYQVDLGALGWLIFDQYININDGMPGSTVESVEVTREAVLGMSGPTFYYGQVKHVSQCHSLSSQV